MKKIVGTVTTAASLVLLTGCWPFSARDTKKQETEVKQEETMTASNRVKTQSGLEYEILQEGTGETPKVGQHVTVHYTGWLDNKGEKGTKFDSSVDRGTPFTFVIGIGQVIKGWDEGVLSMKIGEKRRLIIPSELGYGAYGAGHIIPPHATLLFDVELLKVS